MSRHPISEAFEELKVGRISRRQFVLRAAQIGVAAPIAVAMMGDVGVSAQDATPGASPEASPVAAVAPSSGTENQTRGAGGQLKMLQWQAPSTLNMQLGASFKDQLASCLVTEPLIHFLREGTPIPCLAKQIPSLADDTISADLKSVTYHLLEGVVWSDGQPFTAKDVVFTWKWIMDKANNSPNQGLYAPISNVEAVDDHTVKIDFSEPQLGWFNFFSSAQAGGILPEHVLSAGADAAAAFSLKPIGTGPFVVDSFTPGGSGSVEYSANKNYREPNKPYFATVNLIGGGDAPTAATAVLQTGEADFAWNLLVDPKILAAEAASGKGDVVVIPGTAVEFITLNFSDPNKVVDGQRSQWQTPHPFLTDKSVRQALALGVDRMTISKNLYSGPPGEPPASNVLLGIKGATSPNTTWEYNLDKANRLLDDAGWKLNGSIREKNGVQLKMKYATTSKNDIRTKTQQVIKQSWEKLGFSVDLLQFDSSVFFDAGSDNEDTFTHFYWDVQEYAWSPQGPWPLSYLLRWVSHNGENIPQASNHWGQPNEERYNNPAYDALYDEAAKTTDLNRANELFIQMNDIVVDDVVVIPIVQRATEKYGIAKSLNHDNIEGGPFESLYWNIANWNRVS